MADIRSLEHHTLKVPYEVLNKRFRTTQKNLDREAYHVQSTAADLEKVIKEGGQVGPISGLLDQLEERLVQMQDKVNESVQEELESVGFCKRRVDHLMDGVKAAAAAASSGGGTGVGGNEMAEWKKTRLNRMLVEHFLRSGHYDSAVTLARSAGIEDLTNISLFLVAKEVEDTLNQKDISRCLAWCHDNKSKLRKMKSTLEFNVRLQEFIELIKADQRLEAVKHARKYLAIEDAEQLAKVQKACALLAYPKESHMHPYREMYSDSKWQELIEQFRAENYRLYQLSNQSVFTVALQAGLSALKTPLCYRPVNDRNYECPVCQTPLNELAAPLPFAHCSQSRLICSMSGKPMNEHNHPLMLPNGYVYGQQALKKMADEYGGNVVCPRTKEMFSFNSASKVFIM